MRSLKTMCERSMRSLKAMHRDQIQEHLRFAQELGVVGVSRDRAWRERKTGAADPRGRPTAAVAGGPTPTSKPPIRLTLTPVDALAAVRTDIGDCTRCKLHRLGRQQIVFGVGNPNADYLALRQCRC